MRRTFLAVALAVLGSLLYVPYGGMHRGVIFNQGRDPFWRAPYDSIAVTPLILQTVFFGVVAAVIVNIRWSRRLVVSALCIVLAVGEIAFAKYSWERAEFAERQAFSSNPFISASNTQGHWNNAATNWRFAWQFNRASLAAKRARELNGLVKEQQAQPNMFSDLIPKPSQPSH